MLTASTQGLQPAAQAILAICQHGMGRACGSIFGGFFMEAYGAWFDETVMWYRCVTKNTEKFRLELHHYIGPPVCAERTE